MRWDWYDAPGAASSLVSVALGAVIIAGTISERDRRPLAALGLLALAAILIAPLLAEVDGITS